MKQKTNQKRYGRLKYDKDAKGSPGRTTGTSRSGRSSKAGRRGSKVR